MPTVNMMVLNHYHVNKNKKPGKENPNKPRSPKNKRIETCPAIIQLPNQTTTRKQTSRILISAQNQNKIKNVFQQILNQIE